MSARNTLTPELRAEVLRLEDDLRARVASIPEVQSEWRAEYDAARAAERTAAAWEAWVDERVTLAAVAWVLTTLFVRFCEDNALLKPAWISGPRSREAVEAQQRFLRETARTNADVTDREWLLQAVEHLKSLPSTAGLVDETSPMWLVTPSGDAATRLLNFWRERNENGALIRDLSDPDLDTRFLGDLYQEISEDAKKRYALLQTPVFVEEFILDRTLEPALNERALEGFKMIDPTCGSGHFLLGGFQRLLERWHQHAPGLDERERVQAALDSVYGVDINPFAVEIARFRLTVAALQACALTSLEDAPAFKYHLAAGDSLLHGLDQGEFDLGGAFSADRVAARFAYETENLDALGKILRNDQYDVVVGNPPYIIARDAAANVAYRQRYSYCRGKYALTVPFMERFHALARSNEPSGRVGQITSNSFMKREFGVPLVEDYLTTRDILDVIDTSGVYLPGHGTPTVILVSRNARPVRSTIRVVMGIRSEPGTPADPSEGSVWREIDDHINDSTFDGRYVSVADLPREVFASHPWSLGGGKSGEVQGQIESMGTTRLVDVVARIGFFGIAGADATMLVPKSIARRLSVNDAVPVSKSFVIGEDVRDHRLSEGAAAWFPYDPSHSRIEAFDESVSQGWYRFLWRCRTFLGNRPTFGRGTYFSDGRPWWEWHQLPADSNASDITLVYSSIATHNHYVVERQGRAFSRHASVIKFPSETREDEVLGVAGVLTSSAALFWLRTQCLPKPLTGEEWERRYEFDGSKVGSFPLPAVRPVELARALESLGRATSEDAIREAITGSVPTAEAVHEAHDAWLRARRKLIALQEELDWQVYRSYGIVDTDLTYQGDDLPEVNLGERAFEVALARRVAAGEVTGWFSRHGSTPRQEVPGHWPEPYRELVLRRLSLIESDPRVRLLEQPEHKRRWATDSWESIVERVLREYILDALEAPVFWFDTQGRAVPQSVAVLADKVARDPGIAQVVSLWAGRRDVDIYQSLEALLRPEVVPYLAAQRFKDSGLRKYAAWRKVWAMQREEDLGSNGREAGGLVRGEAIPVPPKYGAADFARVDYWSRRGMLDAPQERFVLYPNAGREGDATPVVGWAGWDHAQQALALATLIQSGEQQGWSEDRLIPLVAGLSELLPWVEQWHSESDVLYGGSSPAEFFSGLLDNYMAKLGATRESLAAWRPPAPTRGRKAKT